ncbi:hypothetical protein M8J75_011479 [Diaphorina citri]|nr:hypothetical protein M8J75_011479 [Diaphorina citri]
MNCSNGFERIVKWGRANRKRLEYGTTLYLNWSEGVWIKVFLILVTTTTSENAKIYFSKRRLIPLKGHTTAPSGRLQGRST